MPEMDGLTILKEIRALDPHAPVIILGGGATEVQENQARALRATDFIRKGLSLDVLVEAVIRLLKLPVPSTVTQPPLGKGHIIEQIDESVLVIDDEPQIVRALRVGLRTKGYEVLSAGNGETGLEVLATREVDVVVLDLGLPGIDGIEVTKRARTWSEVPIIVLSVREGQTDKVAALDAGADDYLTKPFGMDELLARIRAAMRRTPGTRTSEGVVRVGDLEIDLGRRLVKMDGRQLHLTPTELAVLEVFVANPGKLLTHRWLLDRIGAAGSDSQYLRVYVGQLRKKLGDDTSNPRYIFTEPGIGYRWTES